MLQRVSNKGTLVGGPVRVSGTSGISRNPVIRWTDKEFAVAWTNAAPGDQNPRDRYRIFFAIVPPLGDMPRMTRQLEFQGSADQVALASTGTEFGLAWVGQKKPMGSAVFFRRLSAAGKPIGDAVRVTDNKPLACGRPSIAWAGDGYGVAWHDDREPAGSEVFFSYLTCGEEELEEAVEDAGVTDSDGGAPSPVQGAPTPEPKPKPEKKTDDTPKLKKLFD